MPLIIAAISLAGFFVFFLWVCLGALVPALLWIIQVSYPILLAELALLWVFSYRRKVPLRKVVEANQMKVIFFALYASLLWAFYKDMAGSTPQNASTAILFLAELGWLLILLFGTLYLTLRTKRKATHHER